MSETSGLARERRGFALHAADLLPSTASWMAAGFLIALALAAAAFAVFGAGSRGTAIALKVTGMWSFLLFWLAFAGSAAATVLGPRFAGWARRGREAGLSFAAAQVVHLALVLWHYRIATEPVGAMVFFWGGMLCTYALALFSLPQLRVALGPRLWRLFCSTALAYIALVFADDFILIPLASGYDRYPLSYLPFAVMLLAGAGVRIAAFTRRMMGADRGAVG